MNKSTTNKVSWANKETAYVRGLVMWRGDETLLAEDDDDYHQNCHLAPPILPAAFETTIGCCSALHLAH
jgi:hypothetical protein